MIFDYSLAGVVTVGLMIYLVYAPDPNPPTGNYDQAKENLPQELVLTGPLAARPRC